MEDGFAVPEPLSVLSAPLPFTAGITTPPYPDPFFCRNPFVD
jgi:hypothetical protein